MPVASETKETIDIMTLANDNGVAAMDMPVGKTQPVVAPLSSPDMDIDDPDKEQELVTMDMDTLIKTAEAQGVALAAASASEGRSVVIIFDWDDTLLASSYLSSNGHRLDNDLEMPSEMEEGLKQLEQSVTTVLTLAMRFGDVHIVTNAETGWVQLSAQKWMPSVLPLLSSLTIISARSTYEEKFPSSPFQWKFQAMQSITHPAHTRLSDLKSEKQLHVISLGDSHVEREAVRAVTRGLAQARTKSVKFAEHPSLEQLRRQLDLVTNCFQYIYAHDDDLDLMLTLTLVF